MNSNSSGTFLHNGLFQIFTSFFSYLKSQENYNVLTNLLKIITETIFSVWAILHFLLQLQPYIVFLFNSVCFFIIFSLNRSSASTKVARYFLSEVPHSDVLWQYRLEGNLSRSHFLHYRSKSTGMPHPQKGNGNVFLPHESILMQEKWKARPDGNCHSRLGILPGS